MPRPHVNGSEEPPTKRVRLSPAAELALSNPVVALEEQDQSFDDGLARSNPISEGEKKKKTKEKESQKEKKDRKKKGDKKAKIKKRKEQDGKAGTQATLTQDNDDALVESHAEGDGDRPMADAEDASPTVKAKKDKKKKKSKHHESQGVPDIDEEEEEIHQRHKAVFEKKDKSIKAPESVAEPGTLEDQDTQMENAPRSEAEAAHGLEPLPQPAPVHHEAAKLNYATLPPWLAEPIQVSRHTTAAFTGFGLSPEYGITAEVASRLAAKGYKEAFAIQTAVIPQLLPHHDRDMLGDVLVSAATGSGKTLAYALPMIRDISLAPPYSTQLRALVVLPTRELVRQSQQVCEECAGVFALEGKRRRAQIGIAMGSQTLQKEQAVLIKKEQRYDPKGYEQRMRRLQKHRWERDEEDGYNTEDEERAGIRRQEDRIPTLPDHVLEYTSTVDVLICTPGRLVEHIKFTPGFSLKYVRWLIVDEADKLLGQDFQQWLDVVMPKLHDEEESNNRNHSQSRLSGLRKVILSATMTRDLDLLSGLKLRRPKLVVLEGSTRADGTKDNDAPAQNALPEFLHESALKVAADLKPLFLLDLLRSSYILGVGGKLADSSKPEDTSSSSSDSDSSDSDSSSDSDTSDPDSEGATQRQSTKSGRRPSSMPSVLIFTKSNETSIRLSRLLTLMSPDLESVLGTLTSTTPYSARKQTLRAFSSGKLRLIVASDLVARGIDLPSLQHVINYDMPSSVASYVHRVGRTARAGKEGHAWTLFTDPEARWFWKEVANPQVVGRTTKVERLRVTEEKEAAFEIKKARYQEALQELGREAGETRRRGRA